MMKIIKDGQCCTCCALMIANNDQSGCRDYHNHDHPNPFEQDHGGDLVITSEEEVIMGTCDLCGQGESGYMAGFRYAVWVQDHESESLGSCGCTDYHMADCPTRTGYADSSIYDDHELDGYYN